MDVTLSTSVADRVLVIWATITPRRTKQPLIFNLGSQPVKARRQEGKNKLRPGSSAPGSICRSNKLYCACL